MQILVIPSWYPTIDNPISGIFFREQALALNKANCKVSVLAPPHLQSLYSLSNGFNQSRRGIEIEYDKGMPTYHWYGKNWIPWPRIFNLQFILQAGKEMFEDYVAKFGKPDLIHAQSAFSGGVLAAEIKKRYGIPFVITEHNSYIARGLFKPWTRALISKAYHSADQNIAVSPNLGKMLEMRYSKGRFKWSYIPNIVDQRFTKCDVFRKKKNEHIFRYLNIGSLIEIKNQKDLLEAFSLKFRGNNEAELRIGGVGHLENSLKKLVDDLNIKDQVVFLGQLTREQVLQEMQLANVFVLSSHFETFGVVLVEALACGKCVIATACGGPECIVNQQNGLLVPTCKSDDLAKAMQQIYKNYSSYNPIAIQNDCIARFGESTVIEQLLEMYNAVAGR